MKEPPPVEHRIVVPLAPAAAFELFTQGMSRWWPFKGHSCAEDAQDVEFEPRVGGAVTEVGAGGSRHPWGTLTQWQPPTAFPMSWHPAQPQRRATRLQVRFIEFPNGCEVHLIHDGWAARGEQAQVSRDAYNGGWVGVLLIAPIGLVYVPGKLYVREDAAATADHIRNSELLLRIGISSELLHEVLWVRLCSQLVLDFAASRIRRNRRQNCGHPRIRGAADHPPPLDLGREVAARSYGRCRTDRLGGGL